MVHPASKEVEEEAAWRCGMFCAPFSPDSEEWVCVAHGIDLLQHELFGVAILWLVFFSMRGSPKTQFPFTTFLVVILVKSSKAGQYDGYMVHGTQCRVCGSFLQLNLLFSPSLGCSCAAMCCCCLLEALV